MVNFVYNLFHIFIFHVISSANSAASKTVTNTVKANEDGPVSIPAEVVPYLPDDPGSLQLEQYANTHQNNTVYTSSNGAPVFGISNERRVGLTGPVVFEDTNLFSTLQHFNRERIPERVLHAKGSGALGYFISTFDASKYTRANVLTEVGKKTPILVRFSRQFSSKNEPDTIRDGRGFAIKFYTNQGNWDLLGLDAPVFAVRSSARFPSLVHSLKRNPVTNLFDLTMLWDLASLMPETLPQILILYNGQGIPRSYRHINGYSITPFTFTRSDGKPILVKFHMQSNQGIKNMPPEEAVILAGRDSDYHTRDLYNNIANGNYPTWNLTAELLPFKKAEALGAYAFDPTKVWPQNLVTYQTLGTLVLNKNPIDHFAQIEQSAFDHSNMVPGIEPSPDMLQARLFTYQDAQMYRLGVNKELLPVNRPLTRVANTFRDGMGRFDNNQDGAPNYFPSSFDGPQENPAYKRLSYQTRGWVDSYNTTDFDNFSYATQLWNELTEIDKAAIAYNIAIELIIVPRFIQDRALRNFKRVSSDFSNRVAVLIKVPAP